jgi:hypothetical protein
MEDAGDALARLDDHDQGVLDSREALATNGVLIPRVSRGAHHVPGARGARDPITCSNAATRGASRPCDAPRDVALREGRHPCNCQSSCPTSRTLDVQPMPQPRASPNPLSYTVPWPK